MGMQVKSKCKMIHMDAYGGGEQSGKKAESDAKVLLVNQGASRCVSWVFFDECGPSNVISNCYISLKLSLHPPQTCPLPTSAGIYTPLLYHLWKGPNSQSHWSPTNSHFPCYNWLATSLQHLLILSHNTQLHIPTAYKNIIAYNPVICPIITLYSPYTCLS